ncbi:hypothetical protein ANCCEY_08985 [Ancylostoma ceylanicum]|uniref:SXP/RAL-2 family protein Ani s 5-like cation-binding domain-containing protein n=1 Tax=Ancylostoma ceylanicum TaxID=53326 RepID=A0A0D6LIS3_9BILA|nr:hypothetical protein ANCCEY_08985 [Ancylostoma ceylanicum]
MVKLAVLVLFVAASLIYAFPTDIPSKITNITIDSLPGVSEDSIAKLRQMLTVSLSFSRNNPPPQSIEEVKKIAEQWIAGLPNDEKEAIKQHMEEMRQKLSLGNTDIRAD